MDEAAHLSPTVQWYVRRNCNERLLVPLDRRECLSALWAACLAPRSLVHLPVAGSSLDGERSRRGSGPVRPLPDGPNEANATVIDADALRALL